VAEPGGDEKASARVARRIDKAPRSAPNLRIEKARCARCRDPARIASETASAISSAI